MISGLEFGSAAWTLISALVLKVLDFKTRAQMSAGGDGVQSTTERKSYDGRETQMGRLAALK